MDPAEVVETFFALMQARDWSGAGRLLADDVHIDYTATGESFDGEAFLEMNRVYPEGWDLTIVEVIAAGARVAAQVAVRQGSTTDWCAGFYTVVDQKIVRGVEHWVTEHSEIPPDWRAAYSS